MSRDTLKKKKFMLSEQIKINPKLECVIVTSKTVAIMDFNKVLNLELVNISIKKLQGLEKSAT